MRKANMIQFARIMVKRGAKAVTFPKGWNPRGVEHLWVRFLKECKENGVTVRYQ